MQKYLFIDIETFSSVDIKTAGLYKYVESKDFQILILSYAINDEPIKVVDLTAEEMPEEFEEYLFDETIIKVAHNATFERVSFKRVGYDIPANEWLCTAVLATYCGFPRSLDEATTYLRVDHKKNPDGKALIKLFSCPTKPTRANGYKTRTFPKDAPEKWQKYIQYNIDDTEAERAIFNKLFEYLPPQIEKDMYALDQKINDRGVLIDHNFVRNAIAFNAEVSKEIAEDIMRTTGIANPNSVSQIKDFILRETGEFVDSISAKTVDELDDTFSQHPQVLKVLEARKLLGKSSIKKYTAMLECKNKDNRARGLFQFYGAPRTGRWAGRLVQLQNLPRGTTKNIEIAREYVSNNDLDGLQMSYDAIPKVLSHLVRTALIAEDNKLFAVADYSAIESRVLSWIADETWRLDIFSTHGKIYEATASRIFGVPIESVTKTSDLRHKGKTAELALGYEGSLGAMVNMGGAAAGLSDAEMMSIVRKWRAANPNIVDMWSIFNDLAIKAVVTETEIDTGYRGIKFASNGFVFTITLPNGRKLFYARPKITTNKFKKLALSYEGMDQEKKIWTRVDTYGGKLTENIVQAISRDVLAHAMLKLDKQGYDLVIHVHDEAVAEVSEITANEDLKTMCDIMGEPINWAPGLPLRAEGFVTKFYKKD